ncbi:MAG: MotA/TolQ/ExbB proton channel family protein [Acidobacteria bacterium]|nr:MotA/TolQ/ExbB proton channel family protein [Acidobacteriota bacterium]
MQLWGAFEHAGWVGKLVFAVLLLFSIGSWATIIVVEFRFRRSFRASRSFLDTFRRGKKLSDVQTAADQNRQSALAGLFRAGFAEIDAQIKHAAPGAAPNTVKSLDAVERALYRAIRVESTRLQRNVPFLATTAAASPFIGLFGTVWGIMEAFGEIGITGSTSIVAVAPGISEALINTAAGLFAAIPALLAYNRFSHQLRLARGEMEEFNLEFLNLTERNFT